ncbi:hypothetical protein B0J13DRAFT_509161 [Dactylonectria estremocensis]|uniref:Zn(2)-C6 fungal-type domain-containing protein n=1 Tax=Dactylonectria estremocensis TaxID=1079267 RepID=A0A9P9E1S5_9HYPO|nr:hypothetical protein B0J13DRAFT_509161 [Dactylonectria estremocensis]
MVFPGRFSTGCLRCRQRKVKCDEAKPTCRRCKIYGKPCLGYTDQFHFRHTSQKTKSERASTTTASPPAPEVKQVEAPARIDTDGQILPVAIVRQPDQSYDTVSLFYFVRRFVSPDDGDGFPGHFSFLPDLYDHYKHGLLETATLSVSQMAAYNQLGGEELRTQSLRNYASAIRSLQECIRSDDQAIDDRVIATILLLCTYKDISGEGLGDPNEHAPGLFYLLERRGPGQIGTRRGAELFLLAHLRLQIYSFLHEDDKYSDPGAIATVMGLFNPLLRALSMMSKTLSIRHRLSKYIECDTRADSPSSASQSSTEPDEEDLLILECFEMLGNFYEWDQEAASYWQSTFEGRGIPTALGEMGSGDAHFDAETACIIILVRSARLILLLTMLLYHGKLQSADNAEERGYSAQWAECVPVLESDVSKTIQDMLSSVPYALGDIGRGGMPAAMTHDGAAAIIIVHSIRLVSHCAYATPAQLERADIILKRMNSAIGIRSAVGWIDGESYSQSYGMGWAREQEFLRPHTASPSPSYCDVSDQAIVSLGIFD